MPKIIRANLKKNQIFDPPGDATGRNRVKSPPLKYSKSPIKLAKIRVMTRNFKCSVLYLFQTTGENFSLIGALEVTFLGGAAAEGCTF